MKSQPYKKSDIFFLAHRLKETMAPCLGWDWSFCLKKAWRHYRDNEEDWRVLGLMELAQGIFTQKCRRLRKPTESRLIWRDSFAQAWRDHLSKNWRFRVNDANPHIRRVVQLRLERESGLINQTNTGHLSRKLLH